MTSSPVDELFAPLPDIDEVKPLGEADEQCFEELRQVLIRHSAIDRFGIMLLHQHFEIDDDEILVESIDKENRILTSTPKRSSSAGRSVETSWRLNGKTPQKKCETLCNTTKGIDGEEAHITQHYTVT